MPHLALRGCHGTGWAGWLTWYCVDEAGWLTWYCVDKAGWLTFWREEVRLGEEEEDHCSQTMYGKQSTEERLRRRLRMKFAHEAHLARVAQ